MNTDRNEPTKEKNKAQHDIDVNKQKEKIKRNLKNYLNKSDYDDDDCYESFESFKNKK